MTHWHAKANSRTGISAIALPVCPTKCNAGLFLRASCWLRALGAPAGPSRPLAQRKRARPGGFTRGRNRVEGATLGRGDAPATRPSGGPRGGHRQTPHARLKKQSKLHAQSKNNALPNRWLAPSSEKAESSAGSPGADTCSFDRNENAIQFIMRRARIDCAGVGASALASPSERTALPWWGAQA